MNTSVLTGCWLLLLAAPVFAAEQPRELKVFTSLGFSDSGNDIGPIRLGETRRLVLRSPQELAAHSARAKDSQDAGVQKEVQAQLCKLLKVDSIDWNKQMVVVVAWSTIRFKEEVEFVSFRVQGDGLQVSFRRRDLNQPGAISTPRGIALVERVNCEVQFTPPERK